MPIDASIPLQAKNPQFESPGNQLAMMSDAMKIGEMQRGLGVQNELRNLYSQGVDVNTPEGFKRLASVDPAAAMKLRTQGLEGRKLQSEVDTSEFKLTKDKTNNAILTIANFDTPQAALQDINRRVQSGELPLEVGQQHARQIQSMPWQQYKTNTIQSLLTAHERATSENTRRGQDISASTAQRGQDMSRIPVGYRMSADGKALEAIPGGPTTTPLAPKEVQKREASYSKATQAVKTVETKAKTLLDDIQLLKDHPGLDEITGIAGGRLPGYSSSGRAAKAIYDRIVARGGFTELQDMRNASPTGGALGNVSNQENQSLRDAWAAISRIQDAKDLRNQLTRAANDVTGSVQRIREAYDTDYEYKASAPGAAPKTPAATPSAGGNTITIPGGKVLTFPTPEAAAAYKQAAGL